MSLHLWHVLGDSPSTMRASSTGLLTDSGPTRWTPLTALCVIPSAGLHTDMQGPHAMVGVVYVRFSGMGDTSAGPI